MKTAIPTCIMACVRAVASAGCMTSSKRQHTVDAGVGDAGDAGHQPRPRDSGHPDAADTGSPSSICIDTFSKWSALVDAHRQCDRNEDCDQIDDLHLHHCDCIESGIQEAFRGDARAILEDFIGQVTAAKCPPSSRWPPPAGCDVAPMMNLRCENHRCTADYHGCFDFLFNDAGIDAGMQPGDGG